MTSTQDKPGASQVALRVKNPPANAGVVKRCGFDPWVGKIPWKRKPLQHSCLGNSIDRQVWQAMYSVGSQESDKTEHLSKQDSQVAER